MATSMSQKQDEFVGPFSGGNTARISTGMRTTFAKGLPC